MTSTRAHAYGRVMRLLDIYEPLEPKQKDIIREAADSLLFCESIEDSPDAMDALIQAIELGQGLVDSETWPNHRVERLAEELSECGPGPAPVAIAA